MIRRTQKVYPGGGKGPEVLEQQVFTGGEIIWQPVPLVLIQVGEDNGEDKRSTDSKITVACASENAY